MNYNELVNFETNIISKQINLYDKTKVSSTQQPSSAIDMMVIYCDYSATKMAIG